MKKESKLLELAPGITEELMEPDFIQEGWLLEQPQAVYRVDKKGKRYYYAYDQNDDPVLHMSVTTFISSALPTSPYLIDWIAQMGRKEADRYVKERSFYGTFMHIECGRLLEERTYDLDMIGPRLDQYMLEHNLPDDFRKYEDDFRKNILSFAQFMVDYNVVPIAIEIVLTHKKYRVAGALDLVCEMDYQVTGHFGEVYKSGPNKGKPKATKKNVRIRAIVDMKSGKNFYESHIIQLGVYQDMWNSWFPEQQVDHVFNWAPSNWRGNVPTYKLTEQTDKDAVDKIPHLVEISGINEKIDGNSVTLISGIIDIDMGVQQNIEEIDLVELLKNKGYEESDVSDEVNKKE